MKYNDEKGIKTGQWLSNELFTSEDINTLSKFTYMNLTDIIASIIQYTDGNIVVKGLNVTFDNLLTLTLEAGMAISFTGSYFNPALEWEFTAEVGKPFIVMVPTDISFAVNAGGSLDRVDILEVRPVQTSYNQESRQFKDPLTGAKSSANMNVNLEYGFEYQIIEGTEASSPVASSSTVGWIKLAEIYVAAGATTLSQSVISMYSASDSWTTDIESTISSADVPPEAKEIDDEDYTILTSDNYDTFSFVSTGNIITLPDLATNQNRTLTFTNSVNGRQTKIVCAGTDLIQNGGSYATFSYLDMFERGSTLVLSGQADYWIVVSTQASINERAYFNTASKGRKFYSNLSPTSGLFGSNIAMNRYGDLITNCPAYGTNTGRCYSGSIYGLRTITSTKTDVSNDYYGSALAINTSYSVIGARGVSSNKGEAYLTRYSTVYHTFTEAVLTAGSLYGCSVAISDSYVVIGAEGHDGEGAVWVYPISGITVGTGVKLVSPYAGSGHLFGSAVSISQDSEWIAVGARGYSGAFVFHRTGENTWDSGTRLRQEVSGNTMGTHIAMSERSLIISAPGKNKCYLYVLVDGTWTNVEEVGSANDVAGATNSIVGVGIDGNIAVIAIKGTTTAFYDGIVVYHYSALVKQWKALTTITQSDEETYLSNGYAASVALAGNFIAVGVTSGNVFGTNRGYVRIYRLDGI